MLYLNHIQSKSQVYKEAMQLAGIDQVIIASGELKHQFRDDSHIPFFCNAYYREWVEMVQMPDSYIYFNAESEKPVLYIKSVADFWHSKSKPLPDDVLNNFEIVHYADQVELVTQFKDQASTAFVGEENGLSGQFSHWQSNPDSLLHHVDYHRAWKTDYELECMRGANRTACPGHIAAEMAFREGKSELDIHIDYLRAVLCQDHELPYGSIIALNENAAVLHHTVLNKEVVTPRSFLIDAGTQFKGYASDISRTYINRDADPVFATMLERMDVLQQTLVAQSRPGTPYLDIHISAYRAIGQLLIDMDIIKVSLEQAVDSGLISAFFPHGIGHLIGSQVHDRGGHYKSNMGDLNPPPAAYPFLRCTRTIQAKMVLTIEPGVYFIPMLLSPWREGTASQQAMLNWPLIDRLIPYGGIRIEDDIAVHKDRTENLTREAFSALL